MPRHINPLTRHCVRFLSDRKGMAAVEFAYIVPLLMLMIFGTFELSRALLMHKRFQRTTAMVGDLIAREEQLGTNSAGAKSALDGIMRSAEHVMEPYSTAPLRMGIMQLRAASNDANKTTIEWSYSYHGKTVQNCPTLKAMPETGMITAGNAAIVIETEYDFEPYLRDIIPGLIDAVTWEDTMVFAPRDGSVDYGSTQPGNCPS